MSFPWLRRSKMKGCGLADEELFNRMLCMERRRTERTGDPFILMLMELNGLLNQLPQHKIADLGNAIRSVTRYSDFAGWYTCPSNIGMIFTTLRNADLVSSRAALAERTELALSEVFSPAERGKIAISFHFFPEQPERGASNPKLDEKLYPDLMNGRVAGKMGAVLKRSIDIVGSLAGLILLSPVFLVVSTLVRRSSKGPVLFKQRRLGKFGREFDFLKFRTMYTGSDPRIHQQYVEKLIKQQVDKTPGVFKIVNDPRVTRIGRFLRKSSIDELPQFINVLKGEMSLVGPRPPIPYEVSSYKFWHRRRVIEVKPGITGLWQVYGRSRTTFDEMVRLDLRYIRQQSLWLDLKILFKTPAAVLSGDGAY